MCPVDLGRLRETLHAQGKAQRGGLGADPANDLSMAKISPHLVPPRLPPESPAMRPPASAEVIAQIPTLPAQTAQNHEYGLCPDHERSSTGLERRFQNAITDQYRNQDWNGVERSLRGMATGAGFAGRPVASIMLHNFLDEGGDMHLNYAQPLGDVPTVWGRQSAWISESENTRKVTDAMDEQAYAEIRRRVAAGETEGVVTRNDHVETNAADDGDLYFALGKFAVQGEYSFKVNKGLLGLGNERITVEREYTATDRYDWDPPRKCGLVDHVIPDALEQAGHAESFDVEINWRNDSVHLR